MTKRPWIPVALVLVLLIGATLAVGTQLRSRLSGAEAALTPLLTAEPPALLADAAALGEVSCRGALVEEPMRAFYDAVDVAGREATAEDLEPAEVIVTDPTFDSFLLESAIARLTAGDHQLLLRAREVDGSWCLADVEFTTEE